MRKQFRASRSTSPWANLAKTALQTAVFWSLFLGVLPALILWLEKAVGVPHFRLDGRQEAAVLCFALAGGLGLWSGATMALVGQGTPLPFDMANRLVTAGPYAVVRNPMAVAGLAQGAAVGLFLALGRRSPTPFWAACSGTPMRGRLKKRTYVHASRRTTTSTSAESAAGCRG